LYDLVCCFNCPRGFCLNCLKIAEVWFCAHFSTKYSFSFMGLVSPLQAPASSQWHCPVCTPNDKQLSSCSSYDSVNLLHQVVLTSGCSSVWILMIQRPLISLLICCGRMQVQRFYEQFPISHFLGRLRFVLNLLWNISNCHKKNTKINFLSWSWISFHAVFI
jgi:hypothetical protein